MPADTYTSVPSTGKLKLKGVSDGRIDKKKKKKKARPDDDKESPIPTTVSGKQTTEEADNEFIDRSVVLKTLEDEDAQIRRTRNDDGQKQKREQANLPLISESEQTASTTTKTESEIEEMNRHLKTASELRFEEQRRKRLEERLKRDGVKTHKQRVEELNRYLSGLSEHHDMPKIGPG